MSTSAILPISSIDFGSSSATASQQTVFNNLVQQLEQSINGGDLTTSQTLFNALTALSPSAASGSNPLGVFLTSLNTALNDGSTTEAQSALSTYLSTNPSTSSSTAATTPTTSTSATAATIADNLVLSQIQFNLVTSLLGPTGPDNLGASSSSSSSSSDTANSLIGILNAAYPASGSSSSSSTSASSSTSTASASPATPYDALVSSIQSSLGAGNGTITPALAYLQASGNFVNTSV